MGNRPQPPPPPKKKKKTKKHKQPKTPLTVCFKKKNTGKKKGKNKKKKTFKINAKGSVKDIKKEIDQSKKAAEKAARMSKASEYFTQAIYEEDKHKAIELYTKAIEHNPNFSEAYNNRGILSKRKSGDKVGAKIKGERKALV